MTQRRTYARIATTGALAAALIAAIACGTSAPPSDDAPGLRGRTFTNGGFEIGAAGTQPTNWSVNHYLNPGITVQTPQTLAGLNLAAGGVSNTVILSAGGAGPGSQNDMAIGALLKWPRYGQQCAVVNGPNAGDTSGNPNTNGANKNVNQLSQTMTVGAGDVDPADGQIHIRFTVAPVLMNPTHTAAEQPYYMVLVTDLTKNTILYSDFNLSGAGIPWQSTTVHGNLIDFTAWQLVDIAPGATGISSGDKVEIQILASGCQPGAHWGEVYVDGIGPTIPGLSVQGTGPAQANAGANLTYSFTYRNGSPSQACTTSANCSPTTEACVAGFCAETGVALTFATPANTTYASMTPPTGTTCTKPAVGGTGTITCTFTNPVASGASGTFSVTVNVDGGTTGTVSCSNYAVYSTQETTLVGPPITTLIGCTTDANCPTGDWCNETAKNCTPTLANGVPVPTDPAHTNPTLNGTCTAANRAQVGPLVCVSGVCDTSDSECGYKNGDGPCTAANGGVVCRSGVCDPDGKCGYVDGDGPCTPGAAGNGPVVCRSGYCSNNGLCEAAGDCFVDSDCPAADWCNETTNACSPKEANGSAVPTDPKHTNPSLNGLCTAANEGQVGPTVCMSGVCDTNDDKCGYASGDGPCTPATGALVCRSSACSSNGLCEPLGGCNVDADCAGANWCMETTHTCTPKLGNGVPLPVDGTHLNGSCSTSEAQLVCQSGVCDTDNKCGFANGDGTCTPGAGSPVCRSAVCDPDGKCGYAVGDGPCMPGATGNGPVVCRSTACSDNGTCEPLGGCDVDADCPAGTWCDESAHTCTVQLANGQQIPTDTPHANPTLNGTCTSAAGALVCQSGVCDVNDNDCGYAVGDGPCTPANGPTFCRSGTCSVNGTCEPPGGCNVDADCSGAMWCNETVHTCTAQLANGSPIPTDGPHTGPTLNGTCTAPAGALVCQSGVCDTNDNECGFANGDGPCTAGDAPTVCRSGACSTNGMCEPAGGCNVDSDCTTGNWCNETSHACTAQLANGAPLPTDSAHTSPTLDGTCGTGVGQLVCQSGVCDAKDNECGYANGDGPCTGATGSLVCQSGLCAGTGPNAGLCEQCLSSTTCAAATPVCDSTSDTCVACNGDNGSSATDSCPTSTLPYCAAAGTCGKCEIDTDCTTGTHAGPFCNKATGACGTTCSTDAECGAGDWCDNLAGPGVCEPKTPNGQPVPGGTCTTTIGQRACVAGVCDPGDNLCGPVPPDGGVDSGVADSGAADSGVVDSGVVDSGVMDSGVMDSGVADSGVVDSGAADSGVADSGARDAGSDASRRDASADAGRDASNRDAGTDAETEDATGYAQGGGCQVATGTSPKGPLPWIGVAALILARVRTRRRERATKR